MGFMSFGVKAGNFGFEVRGERDRERSTTSASAVNMGDDERKQKPNYANKKIADQNLCNFFFFCVLGNNNNSSLFVRTLIIIQS